MMPGIHSKQPLNCRFWNDEILVHIRFDYLTTQSVKQTRAVITVTYQDRDTYLNRRKIGGSTVQILSWDKRAEKWNTQIYYTTQRIGPNKQQLEFMVFGDREHIDNHDLKIMIDDVRIKFDKEQEVPEDGRRLLRKEGG